MKFRFTAHLASATIFAAVGIPICLGGQNAQPGHHKHHHYKVVDLGTFGGPSSYLNALSDGAFFSIAKVINKKGVVAGWADTAMPDPFPTFCFDVTLGDCFVSHAFRSHDGFTADLGTLAVGWSSAATSINDRGETVGISQNGTIDPLIGLPEQRAVLWRHGKIVDLGTIGGNQSAAFDINNQGQIAGLALNTTPDPFSIYDLLNFNSTGGTETRAVLWDQSGNVRDLGTLGGPDAFALLVNNHGQVTGWSYTNSIVNATTGLPTFHPFLWEKGKGMLDLGTLGGTVAQAVNGMNELGQVVGSTTLAGDEVHHPFLWDGRRMIDLGTFGGNNGEADWVNDAGEVVGIAQRPEFCTTGPGGGEAFLWRRGILERLGTTAGLNNSEGVYVNSKGQVVGYSFTCDFSAFDAFLWEDHHIVSLNGLTLPTDAFHLWSAVFIDDRGQIAALGIEPNGNQHALLLIPCDENHPDDERCDYGMVDEASLTAARNPTILVRPLLSQRSAATQLFSRFRTTRNGSALQGR
jgi:probable HAF family extracellular repeat protein